MSTADNKFRKRRDRLRWILNKYLLSISSVPDSGLGTRDIAMNKTDQMPANLDSAKETQLA